MRNSTVYSVLFALSVWGANAPLQESTAQEAAAATPGAPFTEKVLTNSLGMEFALILPGEFLMGSPKNEWDRGENEQHHRVRITQPYYMAKHEITQGQWKKVMDASPWEQDRNIPHEADLVASHISWEEAREFGHKLPPIEGFRYCLPTEAQWEYACRAGSTRPYCFGDDPELLKDYAWFSANSEHRLHPVGQKKPNAWGLYDMHGGVAEWCQDWYDSRYYEEPPLDDPAGPPTGIDEINRMGQRAYWRGPPGFRVYRGGSWCSYASGCRAAARGAQQQRPGTGDVGLRLAMVPADRPAPVDKLAPPTEKTVGTEPPVELKVVANTIGMKFALVPAGEFTMGSPDVEDFRGPGETQHRVRITKPFYLGVCEVTQEQYQRVMGVNPSAFTKRGVLKDVRTGRNLNRLPVESVSWFDAVAFCIKLSALENRTPCYSLKNAKKATYGNGLAIVSADVELLDGNGYRLPTEAQWEYAYRAGTTTRFFWGDSEKPDVVGMYCWWDGNASNSAWAITGPREVCQKKPNPWGLHGMAGNVSEWCQDWRDGAYYAESPTDDPAGPESGSASSYRVCRGGSWTFSARACRSACRGGEQPHVFEYFRGFRVAMVPSE